MGTAQEVGNRDGVPNSSGVVSVVLTTNVAASEN